MESAETGELMTMKNVYRRSERINSHLCIVFSFETTINSLDERTQCQANVHIQQRKTPV